MSDIDKAFQALAREPELEAELARLRRDYANQARVVKEMAGENARLREALEEIANHGASLDSDILAVQAIARNALEGDHMSMHPDPEMDKAMRRWRERAQVAEAAHQASEEERIQAEKVANALATDLDNWKRDFSFQHQRADRAEEENARLLKDMETVETELDDVRGLLRQHYPIVADNIDRLIAQGMKPRG